MQDATRSTNDFAYLTSSVNQYCQEKVKLQQAVEEQGVQLRNIQMNQDIIQHELTLAKQTMNNSQQANYDGTFIWKITDVAKLKISAESGRQPSIYSPPFYSSFNGYKMCMRLYLNGDGLARSTHISLFFVLMRGEYDAILKWPFHFKVTFCLFDQSGQQRHIIDSFRPDVKSDSFQMPKTSMNVASGIPKFCPLPMLMQDENNYIKSDTMFIKCIVDFGEIPKMILPYTLSLNIGLPDYVQKHMIKTEIERRNQLSSQSQTINLPSTFQSCA
ncbi:unnamed protein product [Didymodactylos carnosus]|nr:unnamed protein product [Didymodactylos carnosus]CAF4186173.1 unnamed protein product [Didymodactylos carnosus]